MKRFTPGEKHPGWPCVWVTSESEYGAEYSYSIHRTEAMRLLRQYRQDPAKWSQFGYDAVSVRQLEEIEKEMRLELQSL